MPRTPHHLLFPLVLATACPTSVVILWPARHGGCGLSPLSLTAPGVAEVSCSSCILCRHRSFSLLPVMRHRSSLLSAAWCRMAAQRLTSTDSLPPFLRQQRGGLTAALRQGAQAAELTACLVCCAAVAATSAQRRVAVSASVGPLASPRPSLRPQLPRTARAAAAAAAACCRLCAPEQPGWWRASAPPQLTAGSARWWPACSQCRAGASSSSAC